MIKIGMIGMSVGNAHPYSWSSIINGQYNAKEIALAGYPAVANYLEANRGTLGIEGARVTHIWCQDNKISKSIAHSAGVDYVANDLEDIVGKVDAVILARDDAEHHVEMSKPFVKAGIPLFVDKPLAISKVDLDWFSAQVESGKFVMSCSSMRYSPECLTVKTELSQLGEVKLVSAVGKKDWEKYGIHMVEALFMILDDPAPASVQYVGDRDKDIVVIEFKNGVFATVHLFKDIAPTLQLTVFGRSDWRLVDVRNSYAMFRDTLMEFIRSVGLGKPRMPFYKTEQIIWIIVAALESKRQDGIKISIC